MVLHVPVRNTAYLYVLRCLSTYIEYALCVCVYIYISLFVHVRHYLFLYVIMYANVLHTVSVQKV